MNIYKQEKISSIFHRKIAPLFDQWNIPIPTALESALIENSRVITAVKGQYIAESGAGEEGYLIYLESGIACCYYYDSCKYIITRITRKDEILIDINTYLHGSVPIENIQMLEAGTILMLNYTNLKRLLSEFPILYPIIFHYFAQREKQHWAYQHLLKSAASDRVRLFLQENPGIATRISNDHIASYLNMNRTTFSSAYAKLRTGDQNNN